MIIKGIMKTSNLILFSAFCLLTLLTACKGMAHRQNSQGQAEIIMEKSDRANDSTAFKWLEGDSIYTFCLTKSDKVIGALGYDPIEQDIVADSLSAVLIAKAAWYPIYGKERIEKEKPFRVTEYIKYWTVEGSLPEGYEGGTAHIIIRKSDGKIMSVWHEK